MIRNGYINKAKLLLDRAERELSSARKRRDLLGGRNGAAKAWLSVIEAVNGLFTAFGVKRNSRSL